MAKKFKTKITEMLNIEHPILCGGMQWISRAEIVAAVANAGGIGFITAESLETPEDLREEIKKIRDLTDKPFGINLSMVPEFGLPERTLKFCDVVVEEGGLPTSALAFDMVMSSSQNLNSFVNFAPPFGSLGDCFGKEQRPDGPFAVLDDSLSIFVGDSQGIIGEHFAPVLATLPIAAQLLIVRRPGIRLPRGE